MFSDVYNLALNHAITHGTITADDLHALMPRYRDDRRIFGTVLRALADDGHIVPNGYKASRRRECHYRPIVQYVRAGAP